MHQKRVKYIADNYWQVQQTGERTLLMLWVWVCQTGRSVHCCPLEGSNNTSKTFLCIHSFKSNSMRDHYLAFFSFDTQPPLFSYPAALCCVFRDRLCGGLSPLHQLFFPCVLESHHAVFEGLDLLLAFPPVLVFGHALLHCVVQVSAARARYHSIHGVVFVLLIPAAIMRRWRGHGEMTGMP